MTRGAATWLAGGLAVLFVVVCIAGVTRGMAWFSSGDNNTRPTVVNDADASAPPDESGDAATSAQPVQDAPKKDDPPRWTRLRPSC